MPTNLNGCKDFVFFNGCVGQAGRALDRYLRGEKPAQGGEQSFSLEHLEQIRDELQYTEREMAAKLTYSEVPPASPGWYWRKEADGSVEVRKVPDEKGVYPKPWRENRDEVMAKRACFNSTVRRVIEEDDIGVWRVEWAGPILEPM